MPPRPLAIQLKDTKTQAGCRPWPRPHNRMAPEPELTSHPTFLLSLIGVEGPDLFSGHQNLGAQLPAVALCGLCDRAPGGDVPLLSPQLHRLCWSLRNSQERRVDLDAEIQKRRCTSTFHTQPGERSESAGGAGHV